MEDLGWLAAFDELIGGSGRGSKLSWLSRVRLVWLVALIGVGVTALLAPFAVESSGTAAAWWIALQILAVVVAFVAALSLPPYLRSARLGGAALASDAGRRWLLAVILAVLPGIHAALGVAGRTLGPLPFDVVAAALALILVVPSRARVRAVDEERSERGLVSMGPALARRGRARRRLGRHDGS